MRYFIFRCTRKQISLQLDVNKEERRLRAVNMNKK